MKNDTIELSESDVKVILQDDYQDFREIVAGNVFCAHCTGDHSTVGITDYKITLNADNDIHLKGKCSQCGGDVGRYIEYGEVPAIYKRAEEFRKTRRSRDNMKVVKKG
ncbi:MAG: hypothetical protein WCG82_11850 [Bacteroidota bacterium]